MTQDEATDHQIREFFCSRGCTAAADFPAALHYKRLLQVFPGARVVLTTRWRLIVNNCKYYREI